MTDSVEARDVIAAPLATLALVDERTPFRVRVTPESVADAQLAALSEHGFTVIRTDPETIARAVSAYCDVAKHNPLAPFGPGLKAALAVLQGAIE